MTKNTTNSADYVKLQLVCAATVNEAISNHFYDKNLKTANISIRVIY